MTHFHPSYSAATIGGDDMSIFQFLILSYGIRKK